jgi:hypothetical protein
MQYNRNIKKDINKKGGFIMYQVTKYKGKNAIYCKNSCTYEYIGGKKKELEKICKELNKEPQENTFDIFYE